MKNIGRAEALPNANRGGSRAQYFSFKDFFRAFQIMATPDDMKLTNKDIMEAKIKFFSKLQKLIDRQNARSVSNNLGNGRMMTMGDDAKSNSGSNNSSTRIKKNLNNSVLGKNRASLKK